MIGLALLLLSALAAGTVVHAKTAIPVAEHICVLGTDIALTPAQALAQSETFNCEHDRFETRAPYVWLRAELSRLHVTDDSLELESDIAPFDGAVIHALYDDGTEITQIYDREQIAAHWRAGTRFALPIANAGHIKTLLIRIDRPWSAATLTTMELMDRNSANEQKLSRLIVFAMYCGFALVPALYSAAFFIVLRYRFMMLHAMMSLAFTTYTFASSNLILHFFPATDLWTRVQICYSSIAVGGAFACLFVVEFLEGHVLSRHVRSALKFSGLLLFFMLPFMIFVAPLLPFTARHISHAIYLPAIVSSVIALWQARQRGSRAVNYLLVGWGAIILCGLDRIGRGMDLYVAPSEFDFSLYFGLAVEAVVTAFGVADRVMALRRERNIARLREIELSRLAETDGLTGLFNRRALKTRYKIFAQNGAVGALAILDVDHFKTVNDTHGHLIGDRVLQALADVLRAHCHDDAIAGRIGGEEFAVLYPLTSQNAVTARIESLREEITRHVGDAIPELRHRITVSVGAAPIADHDFETVYGKADEMLYVAKNRGRNRAEFSPSSNNQAGWVAA